MTPEEQLERVRMCLAEAGRPDLAESTALVDDRPETTYLGHACMETDLTIWRAFALVYPENTSCWSCWTTHGVDAPVCGHPVDPFIREDAEAVS